MTAIRHNIATSGLSLEYPMSLGVYDVYDEAQGVVDQLSDQEFPVEHVVIVGIAFALVSTNGQLGFMLTTPPLGALFGLVWSQIGFTAATRNGTRDFSSVSQVVATKYEVLVEHRLADDARQLLATVR